jgi:hypothetical protein
VPTKRGHALTIRASGLLRVIQTGCQVCAGFTPPISPEPPLLDFVAIWDTGATGSVVTSHVAKALKLAAIGLRQVHGVNGPYMANVYLVNIRLPQGIGYANFEVTEGKLPQGSDVLIGMDIITLGDFAVTSRGGTTVFSFRTPSTGLIDYVKQLGAGGGSKYTPPKRKKRR